MHCSFAVCFLGRKNLFIISELPMENPSPIVILHAAPLSCLFFCNGEQRREAMVYSRPPKHAYQRKTFPFPLLHCTLAVCLVECVYKECNMLHAASV